MVTRRVRGLGLGCGHWASVPSVAPVRGCFEPGRSAGGMGRGLVPGRRGPALDVDGGVRLAGRGSGLPGLFLDLEVLGFLGEHERIQVAGVGDVVGGAGGAGKSAAVGSSDASVLAEALPSATSSTTTSGTRRCSPMREPPANSPTPPSRESRLSARTRPRAYDWHTCVCSSTVSAATCSRPPRTGAKPERRGSAGEIDVIHRGSAEVTWPGANDRHSHGSGIDTGSRQDDRVGPPP
jgi:hypothetical protein